VSIVLKKIAINAGLVGILVIVIGALLLLPNGTVDQSTVNEYTVQKAYLSKKGESYARCYNSINYGSVTIGDARLALRTPENFNTIDNNKLDEIEVSFVKSVKDKCQKTVDDYETTYKNLQATQEKIQNTETAWWVLLLGSPTRQLGIEDISRLEPSLARMQVPFNDFIFTKAEAVDYFQERL
jgi:hypothetical protein